jgi:hypothetical protein
LEELEDVNSITGHPSDKASPTKQNAANIGAGGTHEEAKNENEN